MHTVANGWIYISGAKAINSWQKCTRLSSDSRDILHLEYHGLSLTDGTSVVRGLSVERKELSPASHTAPKTEVCQHSGWMPRYLLWRREGGTARDLLLITSTQSGGHGQLEQVSQRHSPLSWYLSDTRLALDWPQLFLEHATKSHCRAEPALPKEDRQIGGGGTVMTGKMRLQSTIQSSLRDRTLNQFVIVHKTAKAREVLPPRSTLIGITHERIHSCLRFHVNINWPPDPRWWPLVYIPSKRPEGGEKNYMLTPIFFQVHFKVHRRTGPLCF